MKYSIRKRQNPLNRGESKFYASPAYGEEIDVHTLASDISKSSQYIFPANTFCQVYAYRKLEEQNEVLRLSWTNYRSI